MLARSKNARTRSQLRWRWSYLIGAPFLVAEATASGLFALRLSSDAGTTVFWMATAAGATMGTAGALPLARRQWLAGSRGLGLLAVGVWFLCLCYTVAAEYSISSHMQLSMATGSSDAERRRSDAEATVRRKTTDLLPYADAPDAAVADSQAAALQAQIDEIDRTEGVVWKGKPCGRIRGDELPALCSRRASLSKQLDEKHVDAARAQAKQRIQRELAQAQSDLNSLPSAVPTDTRAQVFGAQVTTWLPVVVITLGSSFGFLIGASSLPSAPEGPQAPAVQPGSPAPRQTRRRNRAGSYEAETGIAQRIAGIKLDALPPSVRYDGNSFEATQRQLAELLGYGRNVARLNRELHEAKAAGSIDLDVSSSGTRITLKAPAATQ